MENEPRKKRKYVKKPLKFAERPVGRPTNFTPETIAKLEQVYSIGGTDEEACLFADVSPASLYVFQKKNPKFVERKRLLKEKLVLKSRQVVATNIHAGDQQTAKWYLERKRKNEFSERQEITGEEGSKFEIVVKSKDLNEFDDEN